MATIAYHESGTGRREPTKQEKDALDRMTGLVGDVEIDISDENEEELESTNENNEEEEILIEDDTPDEDKGRETAALDSSYDDDDRSIEEELKSIQNKKTYQRVQKLQKQRHEERRAKEEAARRAEAATQYARQMYEQAERLRKIVEDQSKHSVTSRQDVAKTRLEAAEKSHRDALEAGDAEAISKATTELNRAVLEESMARNARPVVTQQTPAPPNMQQLQPKTAAWIEKNQWFTSNEKLRNTALAADYMAKARGLTPETDSYYDFIDEQMKPLLVANGLAPAQSSGKENPPKKVQQANVTPVSRSSGSGQRTQSSPSGTIKLSRSQAQLAVELMPNIPRAEALKRYYHSLKSQQTN